MREFDGKLKLLEEWMDSRMTGDVCVAFSGGVDSSLILKMACLCAGKRGVSVHAVTFDTMLHPACDLQTAKKVAHELGARHEIIEIDELKIPGLKNNPPDRCYLCKKHLFSVLLEYAGEKGIKHVLDGTNEDDLHVYRPGLRALRELGIESPLAACHISKKETREMADFLGISVASRPSAPCMATRIPYGQELNHTVLKQIEEGEDFLRTVFSGNVRLRLHGQTARIELDSSQMGRALEQRKPLCSRLRKLGFSYITLDLEGFRSGSMDEILPERQSSEPGRECDIQ